MWNCSKPTPSHTNATKWSSEVELIEELPTSVEPEVWQLVGWNVPVVDAGTAYPSVAPARQAAVRSKMQKQVLDQN